MSFKITYNDYKKALRTIADKRETIKEKQMSEEINEDNCVLDEHALTQIDKAFTLYADIEGRFNPGMARCYFHELFQKIHKLNDMAKDQKI